MAPNTPQSGLDSTTQRVETSTNQTPSMMKKDVAECTRKGLAAVRNAVNACIMASALAGGTPAMAEGPQQTPTLLLESKGFSKSSIEGVVALSNFVREKQASGGLAPTEMVNILAVTPISSDGAGLDQIVNTGSKLPKKTFLEVTNTSTLTTENYASVVERLFNPADIDVWLTKPDGTPMNAQEKADYKESLEATKKRWLAKLPELSTAGKQELINRWFTLFNTLASKPLHGSREEYRRGLIAANSIANYSSVPADKQRIFAPATVTQAAEYGAMILPDFSGVKIERSFNEPGKPNFTLKYLVGSDEALKKIGFPEGIQATQVALQEWNQNQAKIYESYSKIATADSKIAASESKIAFLDKFNALDGRFNVVSIAVMKQLDDLPNKRTDYAFIESLNKNLQELKALKGQLDVLAKEDAQKKYIPDRGKETIGLLYATIIDTAKLKKAPIQNI